MPDNNDATRDILRILMSQVSKSNGTLAFRHTRLKFYFVYFVTSDSGVNMQSAYRPKRAERVQRNDMHHPRAPKIKRHSDTDKNSIV